MTLWMLSAADDENDVEQLAAAAFALAELAGYTLCFNNETQRIELLRPGRVSNGG